MRRGTPALVALAACACAIVATVSLGAASPAAAATPVTPRPALPVLDDLRPPVDGQPTLALPLGFRALGALPVERETTAFAAGKVAVAVVFVQSNGAVDRSTEDWTRLDPANPGDRRANVLAKVQVALDWWNERSPNDSLDVFLPAAGSYGAPRTLTTRFEPISRPVSQFARDYRLSDAGWRWDVMSKLGYAHDSVDDRPLPERAYADTVRRKTGADWAFVVYVVDSLRDRDGAFRDGAIAFTPLYGPYTVLTYDNDGYGFSNFDAVLAHEMGHVFGALDEYVPPWRGYPSTGALFSGYLGVQNSNAARGGDTDLPCIMRGSANTLNAFAAGALCPSTLGQTGLRDSDADSRPDVVDTRPRFDSTVVSAAADGGWVVTGLVRERPWPHGASTIGAPFRHSISIFVPRDLQYRIDGGEWLPLTAVDGAFNGPVERWRLSTGPLAAGAHQLELQGTTGESAGLAMELSAAP